MSTQSDQSPTIYNKAFLEKANELKPDLKYAERSPLRRVQFAAVGEGFFGINITESQPVRFPVPLSEIGGAVVFDFGEHVVGSFSISVNTSGNPQDAPIKLKLRFGEMPGELYFPFEDYSGWLSSSWLQEEILYIDWTPTDILLGRRYCFRYVSIEILGISSKNLLTIDNVFCRQQSSANAIDLEDSTFAGIWGDIDKVSRRTLRDCMQDVFEDGPKRDRRLWMGDLRLQALVNYQTFKNYNLVKRCLYLFAGTRDEKGRISSCIFTEPRIRPDTIYLFDYYLLFVPALLEYYQASDDHETLRELWPAAKDQIRNGLEKVSDFLVADDASWWVFIDWSEKLNKQLSAQGVLIYCINAAVEISTILNDEYGIVLEDINSNLKEKALEFYRREEALFVSGKDNQVSVASQVWMILAEVADRETGKKILSRDFDTKLTIPVKTPYLMHYYIEALFKVGLKQKAMDKIKLFWGGMLEKGADTFWEVYNPDDFSFSPYGNPIINSYCHAWSCTPSYFFSKYESYWK